MEVASYLFILKLGRTMYLVAQKSDLVGQLQVTGDLESLLSRFHTHHVRAREITHLPT